MKVLNIRCHVGAQIGAQVYTSIDHKVNGCDMEMNQFGVFLTGMINGKKIEPHFIPHSTIASIKIDPTSYAASRPDAAEVQYVAKNKGGRPAKAQNVDA